MPARRFFMLHGHLELLQLEQSFLDLRVQTAAFAADDKPIKEFQQEFRALRKKVYKIEELYNPAGRKALMGIFGVKE